MSKDDDDDYYDIDEMEQTLTWIGFNTTASREALQIDIEQFEDMPELTKKIYRILSIDTRSALPRMAD